MFFKFPKRFGTIIGLIIGLAATVSLHQTLASITAPKPLTAQPQTIVTLAPSATETVYALGLGPQVAGVTKYCLYPPEAQTKPIVGTFTELNYEAIIKLKPDLVILPVDKTANAERLTRLGLRVLPLDTRSLDGYLEGVKSLGRNLEHLQEAQIIINNLTQSLSRARQRSQGQIRPRVLFSVMHNYEGLGYISEINAVGRDGFFSQILNLTGADNVYQGPLAFPRLSREAIIFLNPDIIVDIIIETENLETVRKDWLSLSSVQAVKTGQIHFLTDQADTVPGPRIHLTIDRLADIFHPQRVNAPELPFQESPS
jgi:iron complex transport system substrate-binding protein